MFRNSKHQTQEDPPDLGVPLGLEPGDGESEPGEDGHLSGERQVGPGLARSGVNYTFVLAVTLLCAILVGGVYAIHTWQMRRLKNDLLVQTRYHREAGNNSLAIRYLQMIGRHERDRQIQVRTLIRQEAPVGIDALIAGDEDDVREYFSAAR